MSEQIEQISARIRELRDILEYSPETVAEKLAIDPAQYAKYETGESDIPIGVLYGLAAMFGVDPTVLLTGDAPRMDDYTLVRKGHGIKVERYAGYAFSALAFNFKNRDMDPMIVTLSRSEAAELVTHAGQEFNYVLEGRVTIVVGRREFTLEPGDSMYFNPMLPHGQRAVTPEAKFLTVINE